MHPIRVHVPYKGRVFDAGVLLVEHGEAACVRCRNEEALFVLDGTPPVDIRLGGCGCFSPELGYELGGIIPTLLTSTFTSYHEAQCLACWGLLLEHNNAQQLLQ